MAKYRKKPVVIEAVRWTGTNESEIASLCGGACCFADGKPTFFTLEGELRASFGDWIIKGVAGEVYPCKPDVFEQTYESAE